MSAKRVETCRGFAFLPYENRCTMFLESWTQMWTEGKQLTFEQLRRGFCQKVFGEEQPIPTCLRVIKRRGYVLVLEFWEPCPRVGIEQPNLRVLYELTDL